MDEWMRQSVSQLKRLIKSRAGRVAELQMEIKILEGIIDRKVREGDLGGRTEQAPVKERPAPKQVPQTRQEQSPQPVRESAPEQKAEPQQGKVTNGMPANHAFEEIE